MQRHDAIPFDDHADLMEHRRDEQRRADTLAWFQDHALERDGTLAFASSEGYAAAPLATFTILAAAANDLGNGWERATIPGFDGAVVLSIARTSAYTCSRRRISDMPGVS